MEHWTQRLKRERDEAREDLRVVLMEPKTIKAEMIRLRFVVRDTIEKQFFHEGYRDRITTTGTLYTGFKSLLRESKPPKATKPRKRRLKVQG